MLTFAIALHSPVFGHVTLPFRKSMVFAESAPMNKKIELSEKCECHQ